MPDELFKQGYAVRLWEPGEDMYTFRYFDKTFTTEPLECVVLPYKTHFVYGFKLNG